MSLKSIRNQINALRRKFAFPLAVLRLRRISEEFCHDWHTALTNNKPLPEAHPFILRIGKEVMPLNTFMSLHHYLNRHRDNKATPEPLAIAVTLLPQHANTGLLPRLFAGELAPRKPEPKTEPNKFFSLDELPPRKPAPRHHRPAQRQPSREPTPSTAKLSTLHISYPRITRRLSTNPPPFPANPTPAVNGYGPPDPRPIANPPQAWFTCRQQHRRH